MGTDTEQTRQQAAREVDAMPTTDQQPLVTARDIVIPAGSKLHSPPIASTRWGRDHEVIVGLGRDYTGYLSMDLEDAVESGFACRADDFQQPLTSGADDVEVLAPVARAIYDALAAHPYEWVEESAGLDDVTLDGSLDLLVVAKAAITALDLPARLAREKVLEEENARLREIDRSRATRTSLIDRTLAENERLRGALEASRDVLRQTPELNMRNYNEDDVAAQNAGLIEVYTILDAAALSTPGQEKV